MAPGDVGATSRLTSSPCAFASARPLLPLAAPRPATSSLRRARARAARMSIVSDVSARLSTAMKARDAETVRCLRLVRAGFLVKMKESGNLDTLTDDQAVEVLRRLAKMRRESITMFLDGGRADLVAQEEADLAIIDEYLPKLADEATTEAWAKEAIEESGAASAAQAGKAMGALMKKHRGDVDGKLAKAVVARLLAE